MPPICPYCQKEAKLVTGAVIYFHRPDLHNKYFWRCSKCDAWVGCHPGTATPLGRLANADLRQAKQIAHAAFDPIWKSGEMTRTAAYGWLANQLGIHGRECHIGLMDETMCKMVVRVCSRKERRNQ